MLLNDDEFNVWSFPVDNQKLARQTVYVALADHILTLPLQFKKKKKKSSVN